MKTPSKSDIKKRLVLRIDENFHSLSATESVES